MTGELTRLGAVTWLSLRGSLRGARLIGSVAFALVPSLIVVAVTSTHPAAAALSSSAEDLFAVLTLPIVTMVIVLVLAVAQFRNEIDNETLLYLSDRSITRPMIVVGKVPRIPRRGTGSGHSGDPRPSVDCRPQQWDDVHGRRAPRRSPSRPSLPRRRTADSSSSLDWSAAPPFSSDSSTDSFGKSWSPSSRDPHLG